MDPSEYFPLEIFEQIISHLNLEDLKTCSQVSSKFNYRLGRFMDKIFLVINGNKITSTQRESLKSLSPSRNYQRMFVEYGDDIIGDLTEVLQSRSKWKTVVISKTVFPTKSMLLKLLKTFEATTEELLLDFITISTSYVRDEEPSFTFPRLNRLGIYQCDGHVDLSPFLECSSLKSLMLDLNENQDFKEGEDIVRLLKNQQKLKSLDLFREDRKNISDYYKLNIFGDHDYQFQLEELTIRGFTNSMFSDHFKGLLDRQTMLRKLHLIAYEPLSKFAFLYIFSIKTLKDLTIFYSCHGGLEIDGDIPVNESVETFTILFAGLPEHYRTILKALPNIKRFSSGLQCSSPYVDSITAANILAENNKKVEEYSAMEQMEFEEVQKILPNVQLSTYGYEYLFGVSPRSRENEKNVGLVRFMNSRPKTQINWKVLFRLPHCG